MGKQTKIEILLSLLFPIVLAYFNKISWVESGIIAMLLFIVAEIINHKRSHELFIKTINHDIHGVNKELNNINQFVQLSHAQDELKKNIARVKHPYFVRLLAQKVDRFIKNNETLFNQEYTTSPLSSDTYGAVGLKMTKKSLNCVSSIHDYWEDRGDSDYYLAQKKLIKKG